MTYFYWFLGLSLGFFFVVCWVFRNVIKVIVALAVEHARVYARSYAKAAALIAITVGATFDETFRNLTREQAALLTWWGWAIMFWKPITAGLAVVVAFLDKSVAEAETKKEDEKISGTQSPFVPQTQPPKLL